MLMFISILLAGVIVVVLMGAIASTIEPGQQPPVQPRVAVSPSRFFGGDIAPVTDQAPVPTELLLSQIERHVRLEQVAAERFVNLPTPESLRSLSESPFVN